MFKLIGTVLAVAERSVIKTAAVVDAVGDTALMAANAASSLTEDKLTIAVSESSVEAITTITGSRPDRIIIPNLRVRKTLAERLEESKVAP